MLSFKSLSVALVGLVLAPACVALAADTPTTTTAPSTKPSTQPMTRLERIHAALERLNLTDEQKTQIKDILKDTAEKLANKDGGPVDGLAIAMDALERISGVLTPQQAMQFRQLVASGGRMGGFLQGGQGGQGGPGGVRQQLADRIKAVTDTLDLTDDQKAKVAAILDDARKQADDIRQSMQNGGNRQDAFQKLQQLTADTQQKLADVLNADQQQKVKDALQQNPFQRGPGGQGGQGGPGGFRGQGGGRGPGGAADINVMQQSLDSLSLTDDQKTKINAILDDAKQQLQAVNTDVSNGGDRQAGYDKMRQIRDDTSKRINDVLTPDQQQMFNSQVGNGGGRRGRGGQNQQNQ